MWTSLVLQNVQCEEGTALGSGKEGNEIFRDANRTFSCKHVKFSIFEADSNVL